MYLEPTIQRKKKRRSSPVRVIFLLIMIGAALYVYITIQQEKVESPFVPTPVPTRSASSYVFEAEELYLRGHLTETIAAYEQAILLEPGNVLLYIPLSRLLALEGRTFEAVRSAQQATEMAPENAPAWAALGMAYDWDGDITEAIDACNRAIELDPTYAEGYAYLAEAYADAGRWVDATQTVQTSLQLDDRSVDAHRNYGYVLELQGNYWGAVEAYNQALEIHPNLTYIHIAIGRNYRRLGDLDAALNSFKQAVEINPGSAGAQFELGWTYLISLGNYNKAEEHLSRAIKADPQFGRAFGALAITYWQHRNYEDAIPNFERAIQLESTVARQRAEAFYFTVEDLNSDGLEPSLDVVMHGDFAPISLNSLNTLQAKITPEERVGGEEWAGVQGTVVLDTQTGKYTVKLTKLPRLRYGQAYVGWFEGVNTLSGDPLTTGPLRLNADRSVEMELEATWVQGPPIEYFYTLGLAYFYKEHYEQSCPLFNAALQIDPEEPNALEGARMCQGVGR